MRGRPASPGLRRTARRIAGPTAQVWVLIGALAGCAVAVGVLVLPQLPTAVAQPALSLPLLIAMFAVAELARVHLHFRGEAHTLTMAEIALVLGLLFAAPVQVLLGQVIGSVLARAVGGRQAPVKLAFNVTVGAFDACVAVLVFRALVDQLAPADPSLWLAGALATLATTVSSTLLVAAIGLSERSFDRAVVLTTLGPATAITLVNTALGLAIGVVAHTGPLATVLLVLPVALVVVGYRAYTSQVEERHRVEVLLACSRAFNNGAPLVTRLEAGFELCRTALRARSIDMALWARPGTADPGTPDGAPGPGAGRARPGRSSSPPRRAPRRRAAARPSRGPRRPAGRRVTAARRGTGRRGAGGGRPAGRGVAVQPPGPAVARRGRLAGHGDAAARRPDPQRGAA